MSRKHGYESDDKTQNGSDDGPFTGFEQREANGENGDTSNYVKERPCGVQDGYDEVR
ncbi:MAG: hypothetical protein ABEK50_18825 [bacterium]